MNDTSMCVLSLRIKLTLLLKVSLQQNLQVNATLINYLWTIGKPIKCNCIFFIHGNKNKCGFFQRF